MGPSFAAAAQKRAFGLAVGVALLCLGCPTGGGPANVTTATVAAKHPPPASSLPGPCVDPIEDAARIFGSDADREGMRVERTVDLDGDGELDPFVTHTSFCGTGGCNWQIYVARGTCAHHVGELFGVLPIARSARRHGLVELEITERNGCAGMARTEVRARFDGTSYAAYLSRTCRCPDEADDDAPVDPERFCETWKEP